MATESFVRYPETVFLLNERQVLATRPVGSRSHDLASTHLACVLLSGGNVSAAIEVFRQMAERGSDLGALALSSLERG